MNPLSIFTGIFSAVGAVFNWITGRGKDNNTPDMKKRDEAQKEAAQNDENKKNIENRNIGASRDTLAP